MALSRLKERYGKQVGVALVKEFSYQNVMQTPRLLKMTLNMGVGEAVTNNKVLEASVKDMAKIVAQQPMVTKAKRSIAAFKLREGMPIGVMATLRRGRMWHFLDKLISIALPQVRDFRGLPRNSFDGRGNYTFGMREQLVFPEISFDEIEQVRGMNVTFHTSALTDAEGMKLLELLGVPFRKN